MKPSCETENKNSQNFFFELRVSFFAAATESGVSYAPYSWRLNKQTGIKYSTAHTSLSDKRSLTTTINAYKSLLFSGYKYYALLQIPAVGYNLWGNNFFKQYFVNADGVVSDQNACLISGVIATTFAPVSTAAELGMLRNRFLPSNVEKLTARSFYTRLWKIDGMRALFKGLLPVVYREIGCNLSIFFASHYIYQQLLKNYNVDSVGLAALISTSVGTACTQPFDTYKTRTQWGFLNFHQAFLAGKSQSVRRVASNSQQKLPASAASLMVQDFCRHGFFGLLKVSYKGSVGRFLSILCTTILITKFEKIYRKIFTAALQLEQNDNPSPRILK